MIYKTKSKNLFGNLPKETKYIVVLFVVSRILILIVGNFSRYVLLPQYSTWRQWEPSSNPWLGLWAVWDSVWYLDIAKNGYSFIPPTFYQACCGQTNYGFFPLYPLLIKLLTGVTSSHILSGVIISNVSLLVASYYLFKVVKLKYNQSTALRSLKYLYLFPTAFVFSGVFTESLFLVLLISSYYYAYKKSWFLSGLLGMLMSLTKSIGIVTIIPLTYLYFRQINFKINKLKINAVSLILTPAGTFLFLIYSFIQTGDLFVYITTKRSGWGTNFVQPLQTLKQLLFSQEKGLIAICIFVICYAILFYVSAKKLERSMIILSLLLFLIPLASGTNVFLSFPRHSLVIFPFFVALASYNNSSKYKDRMVITTFVLAQILFTICWSVGYLIV